MAVTSRMTGTDAYAIPTWKCTWHRNRSVGCLFFYSKLSCTCEIIINYNLKRFGRIYSVMQLSISKVAKSDWQPKAYDPSTKFTFWNYSGTFRTFHFPLLLLLLSRNLQRFFHIYLSYLKHYTDISTGTPSCLNAALACISTHTMHIQLDGELMYAPGFFSPPNLDYKGYHSYIDEILPPESPSLYGLHPNAEVGILTVTSDNLFRTVLEMQPREGGEGAEGVASVDEKVFWFLDFFYFLFFDFFDGWFCDSWDLSRSSPIVTILKVCEFEIRINSISSAYRVCSGVICLWIWCFKPVVLDLFSLRPVNFQKSKLTQDVIQTKYATQNK